MISFDVVASYFVTKSTYSVGQATISTDIAVTIYPSWMKEVRLSWNIPVEWGAATFNVYESASSQSGFTKSNTQPIQGNSWIDRETDQDSTLRVDYYIVEAVLSTGVIYRSPLVYLKGSQTTFASIRAKEISRRESFMLKKYMGIPAVLFKRKTYGRRCSECWSKKHEKIMKNNCPTCIGTSFEGGYFEGIMSYFQFDPKSRSLQYTHIGKLESNHSSCWTTSLPVMDEFDILIRLYDFKVFNIAQVRQTEIQGVTLRQIAALVELSHNAPEFKLIQKHGLMNDSYGDLTRLPRPGVSTSTPAIKLSPTYII